MKLKPRAARRLLLLGVLALVVLIGGVGLIGVRKWQNERRTARLRTDGMAAVQAGDDYRTVDNLGRFLRRRSDDREAWIKFAEARERVEEPSGQHLTQAALAYSRAWALDESDKEVGRNLLRLYNMIGQFPEARDLAARLRPANIADAGPADADVLREEAAARLALKAFDTTLDQITERLVALRPDSYQAAYLRTSFLLSAERKDDAVTFAQSRQESRPTDLAAAFLDQMVQVNTGKSTDEVAFIKTVCNAAGLQPPPEREPDEKDDAYRVRFDRWMNSAPVRASTPTYTEPEFALQLFLSFDRLNMHLHSLMVLKDAASRLKDDDSARLAVRRAWQASLPPEALALAAAMGTPDKLPPETLAFVALAHRDMGKPDLARESLATLKTRDRSAAAQAWSGLLTGLLEKTEARETLAAVDAALKTLPNEPVFLYFRGDMLARLGRVDEARQVWSDLYKSPAAEGWAVPAVRIAETLLDEGRLDEGLRAAGEALRRSRTSAAAQLVMTRAETSLIEAGRRAADPAAVLAVIDARRASLSELPQADVAAAIDTLFVPARVSLLCDLGRKPEAIQMIEQIIGQPQGLGPDYARRLSAVSARHGLGLEDRLLAATASGAGTGDPGTLLTRALLLHAADKRAEGDKLIADAIAAAKPEDRTNLELVRAQYLDNLNDPAALDTWKKLVADHPDSLSVQIGAMRSSAAAADLAFTDRVIERLTALGGSDADRPTPEVRLARARALLHGAPTARNRDEAMTLLKAMLLEAPRLEARDLLINALLMKDDAQSIRPDYAAAIEQLKAAASVAPNRAPYIFRLAGVMQQQALEQGDDRERSAASARAAAELSKLALDQSVDLRDRLQAIDRLAAMLESDSALRAIDAIIAETATPSTELITRRAILLASLRRDREAVAAYRQLLQNPTDDVDTILAAAAGLRALGENAASAEAVRKLDQPTIPPFVKALALGRLAAGDGDYQTAAAEFTRATELAPDDARTWSALARLWLQRGDFAKAEAAVAEGLKRVPNDAELPVILQQAQLASKPDASADLTGLAEALDKVPGMQRRAAAIRAIEQTKKDGKLDDAAGLVRLGEEFADDPTTQLFVARRLSSLTPPRNADAAALLRRAANRFPTDVGIQEQATRTLASIADWDAALVTAGNWRSLSRSSDADLAVAEAQMALNRHRLAVEAVAAHKLAPPPTIPETDGLSLGVLNVRMRGLCADNNPKAALALIQPYLPTTIVRRAIALPAAAEIVKPADEARRWMEAIAAASARHDRDEQLSLARAWTTLAGRFPDDRADLLRRALAVTEPLLASEATATAEVFGARAAILSAAGDHAGAIDAGRKALAADPNAPGNMLGLAGLLVEHGDPAEAVTLATRASQAQPAEAAPFIVLAAAHLKQAERKAAAGDQPGRDAARAQALDAIKMFNGLNITGYPALAEMAAIAEQTGDYPVIIALYERALAAPDAPAGLNLAIVKNNLAYAIYRSSTGGPGQGGGSLSRAKTLIGEAIQVQALAPFYDTLGAIDAAMNDRPGAIAAYRRAIALDAQSLGSMIGLAGVLSTGAAEEKAEAAALLKSIDAAVAKGQAVPDERSTELGQIRSRINGG